MAKKKANRQPNSGLQKQKKSTSATKSKREQKLPRRIFSVSVNKIAPPWMLPLILIITFLAYIPSLNADFVTLDDGDYILNNSLIKDFSNIKDLLATPVQGNHHPLTMLSLAINYQISDLDAWSYHLFNLLFHLFNCFLVFRLALILSRRNAIIAFTTAILFGIHPMHVESVAWVSERKDVLYALFFIAGLIAYTNYVDTASRKHYVLAILFMILSLLSKPAAVIFPVALFCIDLLRKRKLDFKLLLEKTPFFILAIAGGMVALMAQKDVGAMGASSISMSWKILFGFYGIMMYVIKIILPFGLSPFYPYPAINKSLPIEYYAGPVFFIALAVLFFYGLKKNRVLSFGISFYIVNLLLVLQFLPVGSAVIADRYTYIPYIGLFYIAGYLIDRFTKNKPSKAYLIIFFVTLFFSILTFIQSAVWKNGSALWDHAIRTTPSSKAYANRAMLLRKEKNYPLAIEYYRKAISMNKIDHEANGNLANVYFDLQKPDSAFYYYRAALSIKPDYVPALDNMGAMFATIGQYDSAMKYLNRALELKPTYHTAYSNRALVLMQLNRYEEAINDWKKYLEYVPGKADIYSTIGVCYQHLGKYNESLEPLNKAISINPAPEFYLNRSYSYFGLNNLEAARSDALKAKQGGLKIPENHARLLGIQ